MATRRKSSSQAKSGNLFSGIVIGLVIGLAAAVAVALYMNQVPLPFMDKASQQLEQFQLPHVDQVADPNASLYGNVPSLGGPLFSGKEAQVAEQLGGLRPASPATGTTPPTPPAIVAPAPEPDSLGTLIAQLPNPHSANTNKPAVATAKPTQTSPPATYYLQAGAFRSVSDAEAMRARILLLGLDATIQSAPYENGTINRVRVGPFAGLDQMNQARSVLGRDKIETSVVRP